MEQVWTHTPMNQSDDVNFESIMNGKTNFILGSKSFWFPDKDGEICAKQ